MTSKTDTHSGNAAEAELAAIADALRNSGHGWLQVVADFGENHAEEFALLERLAARAQRPLPPISSPGDS